jgi:hypothetical protein
MNIEERFREIAREEIQKAIGVIAKSPSALREDAGLTRDALVKRLADNGFSITERTIQAYENGEICNPNHKAVRIRAGAIAKVLGIKTDVYCNAIRAMRKSA